MLVGSTTFGTPLPHRLRKMEMSNCRRSGSNGWKRNHARGDWTPLDCLSSSASITDRSACHLFEHDIHMTTVKHRPQLIIYTELTLALTASNTLWLAPLAEIWRTRYLEMNFT